MIKDNTVRRVPLTLGELAELSGLLEVVSWMAVSDSVVSDRWSAASV